MSEKYAFIAAEKATRNEDGTPRYQGVDVCLAGGVDLGVLRVVCPATLGDRAAADLVGRDD